METQSAGRTWQRRQLRQTLIATGAVGAAIGIVPVLACLALGSRRIAVADHMRPLSLQALDAVLFFLASVAFCMVVFGLLPMLVQYVFVRAMRRWTGRD